MAATQPDAKITAGQRIRFTTADGATHTVTVARIQVQEIHVYTINGRCFAFLGYEPVELLAPEELF
jgi:plastocyanin